MDESLLSTDTNGTNSNTSTTTTTTNTNGNGNGIDNDNDNCRLNNNNNMNDNNNILRNCNDAPPCFNFSLILQIGAVTFIFILAPQRALLLSYFFTSGISSVTGFIYLLHFGAADAKISCSLRPGQARPYGHTWDPT